MRERMSARVAIFRKLQPLHLAEAAVIGLLVILVFGFFKSSGPPASSPANPTAVATGDSPTDNAPPTLTAPAAFPQITIKNFGRLDERFYRGAQPDPDDYTALAALGIKTIIDLRNDPTDYEKPRAEAAGLKYVNIPMSDKRKPPSEQIEAFMQVEKDESSGPYYVHCVGGRHRTGLIGAIYRYNKYGWDYDAVYREMKNYDYYSRWGHGAIKDYVREYYDAMKAARAAALVAAPVAAPVSAPVLAPADAKATEPVTAPPAPKPTE